MAAEERLKAQLAVLQKELNTPTQFKGRLHELSSLVKVTEDLHLAQQVCVCVCMCVYVCVCV